MKQTNKHEANSTLYQQKYSVFYHFAQYKPFEQLVIPRNSVKDTSASHSRSAKKKTDKK